MGSIKLLRAGIAMLLVGAAPGTAQTVNTAQLDLRVGRLEKEMRAVQRKVFPLGEPVQPELTAAPTVTVAPGSPASTPVSDLAARVGSLEKQVIALTATSEQNSFRIKQLEEALAKLQAKLTVPETPAEPAPTAPPVAETPPTIVPKPAPAITRPVPAVTPTPKPAVTRVDPGRKAAVAAVEMPTTADPIEDEYTYGFRLYTAKFYPEAQVKLKEFVAKHPAHKRASYAQNLLGRAFFDEGKPALASVAFYDNYQKMPTGERAPESLYWLGQSLTKLKKLPDACKVYDELSEVYGAKLSADLKARAAKGRADAKCTA